VKKTIFVLSLIFVFSTVFLSHAQSLKIKYPLTEQDIEDALKEGSKNEGRGLHMKDEWKFLSSTGTRGFSIWMVTPYSRICNAAYDAKRRYIEFTKEDVIEDEEFFEPVVQVIAYPDPPIRPLNEDLRKAQNVDHVVLADTSREVIVQPLSVEPFDYEYKFEDGTELFYKGLSVEFAIEEVLKISENDIKQKGEFYVKVIGSKKEKEFKIKAKHLKNLK
jgi:hypothetical protein